MDTMQILAAIAILAFVGFLAFRMKHMFQSDVKPEAGISKTFIVLIIFIPIILVLLYSIKMNSKGGISKGDSKTFQPHEMPSHQEDQGDGGVRVY